MTGSTARVTFTGPNRLVSTWALKSSVGSFLEEPGVEVTGVVDEDVDTAEALNGGGHRGLRVRLPCDVELDDQQVIRLRRRL